VSVRLKNGSNALFSFFLRLIYFRERERDHVHKWGKGQRERERERENPEQAPCSALCPTQGSIS